MSLMYENTYTFNPFVGCKHGCIYCYARKIAKRQKHRCIDCYNFVPHEHPERLGKKFPKGSQVFVCSMGDITFATEEYRQRIYDVIREQPGVTFLLQTKDPIVFMADLKDGLVPENTILGITLETDKREIIEKYSNAIYPFDRVAVMELLKHRKYVTIEPIMDFDLEMMVDCIRDIDPEFVYIGYDNHRHRLPEPSLEKTLKLINELETFTEVRKKTIRRAWWEESKEVIE